MNGRQSGLQRVAHKRSLRREDVSPRHGRESRPTLLSGKHLIFWTFLSTDDIQLTGEKIHQQAAPKHDTCVLRVWTDTRQVVNRLEERFSDSAEH